MAVAFVKSHTLFTEKVLDTSASLTLATSVPAGNLIVALVLFDNAGTASKPLVSSITKQAGETANWVSLGAARSTSTSIGAFSSGELWAIKTTVAWSAASYTITLDTSVTQKATQALEFTGAEATLRSTAGTAYSTTTTAASATTTGTTPVIGDLAVGFLFGSNIAVAPAGDTDTTGGSWSTAVGVGSTGGSGATNNFGIGQYKILTAASHQTYNSSAAGAAGNGAIVAILQASIEPRVTQAAYRFYEDGTETGATALAAQDTAPEVDTSSGDVNLGLRMRLQETAGGVVPATTDWQLQWEKSASGIWGDVGVTGPFTNYPDSNENAQTGFGRTITNIDAGHVAIHGNGGSLLRLRMTLSKVGSPTSNITATVYAHSGTYGSGTPTGPALTTSAAVSSASLTTTSTWTDFDFDGSFTLASGTDYFIGVETAQALSATDYPRFGIDSTSPTYAGNLATRALGSWTSGSSDGIFECYTSPAVAPYDSAYLTDAAVTTNRLGAGTGSFVAGKVSEDGLVDDLGWPGITTGLATYGSSNDGASSNIRDPALPAIGQSFMGDGRHLTRAGFYMLQVPATPPNGTVQAELWSHTGTYGSGAVPTTLLATSTTVTACTSLNPTTPIWQYFDFPAGVVLASSTPYFIVVRTTNTVSGGVGVRFDDTSPTDPGNGVNYSGGAWGASSLDRLYEVYTSDPLRFTEVLYSVTLKQADLSPSDTLRFRVLKNGATTDLTYTSYPSVTIGAGGPATINAVVALTASSTLTTTALVEEFAAVALTATSTLTATGTVTGAPVTVEAAAALTATSTLTATAFEQAQGAVSLFASSTLTTTAIRFGVLQATVPMSAASTLTVTAVRQPQASVSLVAASSLTTDAVRSSVAAASLSASSTLTVSATTTAAPVITAAVALTGVSALSVSATVTAAPVITASVALTATSTLTATGIREPQASVSLTAASTLNATAERVRPATVPLSAISTLSATGTPIRAAAVPLAAVSTLTVTGVRASVATVAFTAVSTLSATAVREPQAAVSLTATSTLTATADSTLIATVALTATSTLTVEAVHVVIVGGAPTPYLTEILVDTPQLVWMLNDPPGSSSAADATGNGLPGSIQSSVVAGGAGSGIIAGYPTACSFPGGTTSSVLRTSVTGLPDGTPYSVEAWIKTTTKGGWVLCEASTVAASSYGGLRLDPTTGVAWFRVYNTGSSNFTAVGTVPVTDGLPHHLVGAFDGAGTIRLYVDGVLAGTQATTGTVRGFNSTLRVANDSAGSLFYTGVAAGAAFYPNLALSPTRVAAHYTAGTGGGGAAGVPLTAVSTLTASAITIGASAGVAALAASSTLTTSATRTTFGTVTLSATAVLTVSGVRVRPIAVSLTATSSLTATAERIRPAVVPLVGVATLTVTAVRSAGSAVGMVATATLTVVATTDAMAAVLRDVARTGYLHALHTDSNWYPVTTAP